MKSRDEWIHELRYRTTMLATMCIVILVILWSDYFAVKKHNENIDKQVSALQRSHAAIEQELETIKAGIKTVKARQVRLCNVVDDAAGQADYNLKQIRGVKFLYSGEGVPFACRGCHEDGVK